MIPTDTLTAWRELAKRDDCFRVFVPSDIRQMIGEIDRLSALAVSLATNLQDSRALCAKLNAQ